MATNKPVFTLRLNELTYQKIGYLATAEHRSMTNYIEYVLLKHIAEIDPESEHDAARHDGAEIRDHVGQAVHGIARQIGRPVGYVVGVVEPSGKDPFLKHVQHEHDDGERAQDVGF